MKLDKQCFQAIKGIAILFMIVHHVLGLPEMWFEEGLGYGQWMIGSEMLYQWIGNPTKICVGTFAFLSGWIYYYHGTPTVRYGFRKAFFLFLQYWLLLFVLFYPLGYVISRYIPSWKELILNLFCIHERAICFSWYVLFYGCYICSLPVLIKIFTNKPVIDFVLLPVLFTVIGNVIQRIQIQKWYLIEDLHDYFYWMPIVWIGYLYGRYGLYQKIKEILGKKISYIWGIGIFLIPILRGRFLEVRGLNLDVLYAPVFVFCCICVFQKENTIIKSFRFLGKYSLYIWLIHSIFFWKQTRSFFQPIVYSVGNPIITIFLVLIISLCFAIVYYGIWNRFKKVINL